MGMIVSLQTGIELSRIGQQDQIGTIVAVSMAREMGPFITATILAATVGSSIAAELGTMAVSDELAALEVLSIDRIRFLVLPRLVALAIAAPLLTILCDAIGIFGGGFVAQSQLNVVNRDLERERSLLSKGAATADGVRSLEDRLTLTQAMVREAEIMLGYATIRAPFDGVVSRKPANAGDFASPGMPLLELEGTDAFQVEAAVPDSLAAALQPGPAGESARVSRPPRTRASRPGRALGRR